MINSIVDEIFVITTFNSNRVDYIKNHLRGNNIKFNFFVSPEINVISDSFIVRDGGDTTNKNHRSLVSLISSFASIIEISKITKFEKICIIEDDCFFTKNWQIKFQAFVENLPNEWDLLNVGYHPLHDTDSIKESLNDYVNIPLNHHWTTHCIIIKNTCYDKLLNTIKEWNYSIPMDYIFNEIYKNKNFKSYIPKEHIVYQLSYRNSLTEVDHINNEIIKFKSTLLIN